jgi:hypothetical protein
MPGGASPAPTNCGADHAGSTTRIHVRSYDGQACRAPTRMRDVEAIAQRCVGPEDRLRDLNRRRRKWVRGGGRMLWYAIEMEEPTLTNRGWGTRVGHSTLGDETGVWDEFELRVSRSRWE